MIILLSHNIKMRIFYYKTVIIILKENKMKKLIGVKIVHLSKIINIPYYEYIF